MNSTLPIQHRREFLKKSILAFGGVLMLPSCLKNYTPFVFLTPDEALLLVQICEQIIPADSNGPGATQAGVVYYIDKQLHEVFHDQQLTYRNGLKAFEETCKGLHQKGFEELSWDEQHAFLTRMEQNQLPGQYWEEHSAQGFFNTMIRHTMQGFYGSPRHGGNKDYMSYRMIRLDYPYVIGRNLYRD